MDIINEIKKLNFSLDSYIVVGSGYMAVLGLKEAHDIDIVVTSDLFSFCRHNGWESINWTYPEKLGRVYLRKGLVELYEDVNCGNFQPSFDELLARSVVVEGVRFASLEDILALKKEYLSNNPKHLKDIKLISEYLTHIE